MSDILNRLAEFIAGLQAEGQEVQPNELTTADKRRANLAKGRAVLAAQHEAERKRAASGKVTTKRKRTLDQVLDERRIERVEQSAMGELRKQGATHHYSRRHSEPVYVATEAEGPEVAMPDDPTMARLYSTLLVLSQLNLDDKGRFGGRPDVPFWRLRQAVEADTEAGKLELGRPLADAMRVLESAGFCRTWASRKGTLMFVPAALDDGGRHDKAGQTDALSNAVDALMAGALRAQKRGGRQTATKR